MSVSIHKSNVRAGLEVRREPHWGARLAEGRYLGFRKLGAHGSWIARARLDEELRARLELAGGQTYRDLGPSDKLDYDAACRAARAWFAELDAGVKSGPFTVEDACKEYVEDRQREKGDKCAADSTWRFERAVYGSEFGRTQLAKLRTPVIKAWRDALLDEDEEGRQMGRASVNRIMATVRAALNMAVKHRRVTAAAAQEWREVEQYKGADGRREIFLDIEQRRALLAAADPSTRDLLEAALLTGARPGELVSAKRSQFDARTKTLKLVGKTGARDVPLSGQALALFERLSKSKLPAALLLTCDGRPWARIDWSRRIRAAVESAELPAGTVLYSCRHSYISQAILDGLSILDVARLTGTSIAMIDANYGHLAQNSVRERLDQVRML